MTAAPAPTTYEIHVTDDDLLAQLRSDAQRGLSATPKWLVPRWFYDAVGSRLFDEITRLPEYYLTRTETSILHAHAHDIAAASGAEAIVELGSGYSTKTRLLIDALRAVGTLKRVVGFDVSIDALREAMHALEAHDPGLELHAIAGDYHRHMHTVPHGIGRRMLVFLGSTIGNLIPGERRELLEAVRDMLDPGECFLVGVDLVKDARELQAAYDDAAGVTAEFNRNVLRVLERRLHAELEYDAFAHAARWDPTNGWVEITLRAVRPTTITIPPPPGSEGAPLVARFTVGEPIHTEVSTKFSPDAFAAELAEVDLPVERTFVDGADRFELVLARRA